MLFTEPTFLFLFLPALLGLYFLTRVHARYANWLLVAASVLFYAKGGGGYTWLMLGSIAFNYGMAIAVDRARDTSAPRARALLATAIAINLVVLGWFKYAPFLAENASFAEICIALDHLDAIIALIRKSKSPEEARTALMRDYPLSIIQAQAILDMKLQRLTGLERENIIADYKETLKEIERLKTILENNALVSQIIKDELIEIQQQYADERKTEITAAMKEITIEDLIPDEETVVTLSHQGYIKRNPLSAYRSQRRGGKGLIGMETKEEDFVRKTFSSLQPMTICSFSQTWAVCTG